MQFINLRSQFDAQMSEYNDKDICKSEPDTFEEMALSLHCTVYVHRLDSQNSEQGAAYPFDLLELPNTFKSSPLKPNPHRFTSRHKILPSFIKTISLKHLPP